MKNSTSIFLYVASGVALVFAFMKSGFGKVIVSPGSSVAPKADGFSSVVPTDVVAPPPIVSGGSTVSVSVVPEPVLGTIVPDVYASSSTVSLSPVASSSTFSVVPDPSGSVFSTDFGSSLKFHI